MIRQVKNEDFQSIKRLQKPLVLDVNRLDDDTYRWQIQENGFLVGEYTEADFKKDLNKIFLVYEISTLASGYIRIDEKQEYQDNEKKVWLRQDLKTIYYTSPHAEIGALAVSQENRGKGVATELLNEAVNQVKGKGVSHLFSIVTFAPVTNFPSMMFHEKYGFERVAFSLPSRLFGLESYQSILYGKRL